MRSKFSGYYAHLALLLSRVISNASIAIIIVRLAALEQESSTTSALMLSLSGKL